MADIDIIITIEDAKIADFKEGFLKAKPKTGEDVGLTDLAYFKKFIQDTLYNVYRTGKIMIASEATAAEIDEDIIQVV